MKYLKVAAILLLALVMVGPAFAETQTVKVSGDIEAYYIYRDEFDLSKGNDSSVVPATVAVTEPNHVKDIGIGSAADDYFMSIAEVEIAADLTDNVGVVIRLMNQRDWNAHAFEASTDGSVARGAENTENEFDVGVDLAYVTMKEIFYAPLTLTIGRQDLWFGRGFIIGKNYQDPQNSIQANELTAVTSFDALRATLDFAPWTIDAVYAVIDQNDLNKEENHGLWILNVNYQFSEYNAEAEVYFMADLDRATLTTVNTTFAGYEHGNDTYTVGLRGQFDPIKNITLGAEGAWQMGDYKAAITGVDEDRDISAFGAEVFGEYRWNELEWKPMIGLQYVFFSGDDGLNAATTPDDYEGWNRMYRGSVYGDIRNWQEVYYGTAQLSDQAAGSNQQHVAIYGDLKPMEDLKIDGQFYWFWNDEDIWNGSNYLADEVGNELDIHVKYDYTEDVAFGLGLAWFFPGDMFSGPGESAGITKFDSTATQIISSVKVNF